MSLRAVVTLQAFSILQSFGSIGGARIIHASRKRTGKNLYNRLRAISVAIIEVLHHGANFQGRYARLFGGQKYFRPTVLELKQFTWGSRYCSATAVLFQITEALQ
ncbi:MAG TPA: hypothetical protein VHM64_24845 [Candidatus Binatia bacterium]|nr:hypothetical protein [Candidatus Binatia bacterium]